MGVGLLLSQAACGRVGLDRLPLSLDGSAGDRLDAGANGPPRDAGEPEPDVDASLDAGSLDAGAFDAGVPGLDAGTPDLLPDAGAPDAGTPDAGPPVGGSPVEGAFDTTLGGWGPIDVHTAAGFLDPGASGFGGVFDEYWHPDLGDGDRCIGGYRTGVGLEVGWAVSVTNTGTEPIRAVDITYDLEVHWYRFQGSDMAAPNYGVRAGRVRWRVEGVNGAPSPEVRNETLPPGQEMVWMDDALADSRGYIRRGEVSTISGLDIAPGAAFTISFRTLSGDFLHRHSNFCVDNVSFGYR